MAARKVFLNGVTFGEVVCVDGGCLAVSILDDDGRSVDTLPLGRCPHCFPRETPSPESPETANDLDPAAGVDGFLNGDGERMGEIALAPPTDRTPSIPRGVGQLLHEGLGHMSDLLELTMATPDRVERIVGLVQDMLRFAQGIMALYLQKDLSARSKHHADRSHRHEVLEDSARNVLAEGFCASCRSTQRPCGPAGDRPVHSSHQ